MGCDVIHHVFDGVHDTLWPSVFLNMKYTNKQCLPNVASEVYIRACVT